MIPPRKKVVPPRKNTNVDLVIHCSKCGHGMVFKVSPDVDYTNITNRTALLNQFGWQNMPRVLCRSCACPMDADEMIEWKEINIADVNERKDFIELMREKYGWKIERFFATTE